MGGGLCTFRIWLLDFEDLIGGLALQTAAGHGEVPNCDTAADVSRKFHRRIAGGKVHFEDHREIDILITEANQYPAASTTNLFSEQR